VARVNKSGSKASRAKAAPTGKPKSRGASASKARRQKGSSAKPAAARQPKPEFRVKELNAQQKCGQGTSVERLFRVDERADGAARAHLVFLDRRHGWYCEHGVECPAVGQARRIGEADRQRIGRTNNGGMRA
jgi:hypothetical protein